MLLKAEHLFFSYRNTPAIGDLSLEVGSEELIGLLGKSGAGKTTLLKLFAGLLACDSGMLSLDRFDPMERPLKYRKGIAFLPESCPLYQEMTVQAYLSYRARLKGERILRARRRVEESARAFGLQDCLHKRIANLSYGFRKRIGLADVLLRHSKLMLLDDPMASLDYESRKAMLEILKKNSERSSILLAGHEVDDILSIATRIVILRDGKVVYDAPRTQPSNRGEDHQRDEVLSYL